MRSTRAAAAVSRLNARCPGEHYTMSTTGTGLFCLIRLGDASEEQVGEAAMQDDFVRAVNALGPQEVRRVTRADAAFERQLVKKPAT